MRVLTLILLLAIFSCQSKSSESQNPDTAASSDTSSAKSTRSPYVFMDTILVSIGPKDFDAVTKSKPNMPVLDLRSEASFKAGHIWRSVNIDFNDPNFYPRIASFGRNQEYAVYCQTGEVSYRVAEEMKKMGFLRIYHLQKGLVNWGDSGQALQLK
jgi:rhodanese-related sulfurtransferase